MNLPIDIPQREIEEFCRRWHVEELALFGSVLSARFGPESDVDVLVTFQPETRVRFRDLDAMEQELSRLFSRPVDLVSRRGVEQSQNLHRREWILSQLKTVYRAA